MRRTRVRRKRSPSDRESLMSARGATGVAVLAALLAWALLAHDVVRSEAGGSTSITNTTSTATSTETVTTTETQRVDTHATRLVAIDPVGAVVSDQTFPVELADAAVLTAIADATAALLAGSPASLFVKGPALVATTTVLVDTDVDTVETGRMDTETVTLEERLGPDCTGIGDRDVPNTAPCGGCMALSFSRFRPPAPHSASPSGRSTSTRTPTPTRGSRSSRRRPRRI